MADMPHDQIEQARQVITNWDVLKWGLGIAGSAMLAMMGFIGRDYRQRLLKVESNYVNKDTFNDTVNSVRADIKEGNKRTHERLDELMLMMAKKDG